DITSGKYVFQVTEAYKIADGKLGGPLKGAMLIGNGPTDLNRISMVGNDLKLDTGIGTCGKNGQGVPVGGGQPTLRMDRITVGGTGGGHSMSQINLELDDESIAAAKEAGIDLSQLLVHALRGLLPNLHAAERAEAARQWYEENKEAVDAYNKMIEEDGGLFYERCWRKS